MRTFPNIGNQPKQPGKIVRSEFTLAASGDISYSDIERKLLAFPSKLGGLGISNF